MFTTRCCRSAAALALLCGLFDARMAAAGLTAEEAVRQALARNPELQALRQGRRVAAARVSEAGLLPSPEVRVGLSGIADDPNLLDNYRSNVGLRWSPPRPGEMGVKTGTARTREEEAASSVQAAEQKLAAEVRLLHQTICLLDEQARAAEESVRVRRQLVEAFSQQVEAGVKSALDRGLAELALADAGLLPERYRAERRMEAGRLLAKMGLPQNHPLELSAGGDPLAFAPAARVREKLLTTAFGNRAEVDAARARCRRAELALSGARGERYPWFSYLQLGRRIRTDDPSSWSFQFGIDLPVFRWGGAGVKAASAELDQCRLEEQAVRAGLAAEVDEVLLRLEGLEQELKRHAGEIAALSERQVELASSQLAAGQADLLEPLLARTRQLSARQTYISRLMEYRALEIGLEQAVGEAAR